jgi:DNA repair exonuclease SbcCD nuclease subunit
MKPGLKIAYPGSTQRMSFAEKDEEKGFIEGELIDGRIMIRFIPLPAYDMELVEINTSGMTARECEKSLEEQFWRLDREMVIRFQLTGGRKTSDYPDLNFERIRALMPPVLECQFAIRAGDRWVLR